MRMSNITDTNVKKKTKVSANEFPTLKWVFQAIPYSNQLLINQRQERSNPSFVLLLPAPPVAADRPWFMIYKLRYGAWHGECDFI